MTTSHETMQIIERFGTERDQSLQIDDARVSITVQSVERLIAERKDMVRAIRSEISSAFYDAICAKIEYEKQFLLDAIDTDMKRAETHTRRNKVLPSEYFVQRHFDPHLI